MLEIKKGDIVPYDGFIVKPESMRFIKEIMKFFDKHCKDIVLPNGKNSSLTKEGAEHEQ